MEFPNACVCARECAFMVNFTTVILSHYKHCSSPLGQYLYCVNQLFSKLLEKLNY